MTKDNHVKAIHVFNEKNPQPNVITVRFGPRAGKAHVSTRIRLADTQKVIAIAEMSDGTFWSDSVEVWSRSRPAWRIRPYEHARPDQCAAQEPSAAT